MSTADKLLYGNFIDDLPRAIAETNSSARTVASYLSMGEAQRMFFFLSKGQRLGQAFFNALTYDSQAKLRGTEYDPFHTGNLFTVLDALDFLTRKD